jgi:beta-lactamase class A
MHFRTIRHSIFSRAALVLIIGIGVGFVIGYGIKMFSDERFISSIQSTFTPIEEKGSDYAFIHPLLAYRTPEATLLGDYTGLLSSLQSIISTATSSGGATRVSVYFRDLDAGKWVGVNQDATYHLASMLKVPVLFAYMKEADEDPSVFAQSIAYDPSVIPDTPFEATSTLVAAQSYSIKDLITHMIVDSDNGATFTLLNAINPDFFHSVYTSLGIQDPGDNSGNYQISARTYGLFFRILYNATYLTPAASEQALKLLSQATFTDGLVAGVPAGTTVAHKYGEYVLAQNNVATGVELSDCGIVYYPAHPYLLCVMTSAVDVPTAEGIIANISRASYAAVAKQYPAATPST